MRLILLLLFLSASKGLLAQESLRTLNSPDGAFHFAYPSYFVQCTQDSPDAPWGPDDCSSYIPVCESSDKALNVACVAYPKARFQGYPTFGAATFSAAEERDLKTEKDCLAASGALSIPKSGKATVLINGVRFKVFDQDGAVMGNALDGHVYRTFHASRCYQLATRAVMINPGVFEQPVKQLTSDDWKKVNDSLQQIVRSFRFLK